MKIGILSDTHGNAGSTRHGLELLTRRGAEMIVHCGDIGSVQCLDLLSATGLPVYAVAGNVDAHNEDLELAAEVSGVHFASGSIAAQLPDGRFIAATHGNDSALLQSLIRDGRYAYVFRGHSHQRDDQRFGGVRVINPGALQRAHPHTVALLDTDADALEFIEVP